VTIEAIQDPFHRREDEIEDVRAAFICNADESGFQDFVDAREIRVIVPAHFDHDSMSVPGNQSEKRATMLAAESAHGFSLKPMIII
jgi:hypothetical protein